MRRAAGLRVAFGADQRRFALAGHGERPGDHAQRVLVRPRHRGGEREVEQSLQDLRRRAAARVPDALDDMREQGERPRRLRTQRDLQRPHRGLAAARAQQRRKRPRTGVGRLQCQHAVDGIERSVECPGVRAGVGQRAQAREVPGSGLDHRPPLRDGVGRVAELPRDLAQVEAGVGAVLGLAQCAPVAQQCVDRASCGLMRAAAREPFPVALERHRSCLQADLSASITDAGVTR